MAGGAAAFSGWHRSREGGERAGPQHASANPAQKGPACVVPAPGRALPTGLGRPCHSLWVGRPPAPGGTRQMVAGAGALARTAQGMVLRTMLASIRVHSGFCEGPHVIQRTTGALGVPLGSGVGNPAPRCTGFSGQHPGTCPSRTPLPPHKVGWGGRERWCPPGDFKASGLPATAPAGMATCKPIILNVRQGATHRARCSHTAPSVRNVARPRYRRMPRAVKCCTEAEARRERSRSLPRGERLQ